MPMQDLQEVHRKITAYQAYAEEVLARHAACEKLQATKLVACATMQTLQSGRVLCEKQISVALESSVKQTERVLLHAQSFLQKLPAVAADEGEYRTVMSSLNKDMANESRTLKKKADELCATIGMLNIPNGSRERALASVSDLVSRSLTLHVTFFACVTLLRSPALGGKSADAKKIAKSLEGLVNTFLKRDWPCTSDTDLLQQDCVQELLQAMVCAVSCSYQISFVLS
jgi:prefoldin subunit 5